MALHREKNITYDKIRQRFFWYKIAADINGYVESCEQCQKQGDLKSPTVELKRFVNGVCKQLHELTGIEQCYVCLSPSGERIGRTSKPNSKDFFAKGFRR